MKQLLGITLLLISTTPLYAEDVKRADVDSFLKIYCHECHADGESQGGLTLDTLPSKLSDAANFSKWVRVHDRVNVNEMPPKRSEQPSDVERQAFLKSLNQPLTSTHAATKGTVLRRLNRQEYQNTLNDLFGTHLNLAEMLPEDGRSHEFDTVGETLNISMVQLQQYLAAIDKVMDADIATTTTKPKSEIRRVSYADTREGEAHIGEVWRKLDDGAVVFFNGGGYPSGMLRDANIKQAGYYKIRVTGYAYQSEKPITFAVGATTFQRAAETPTFGYFEFQTGKPQTIEVQSWIDNNYMIEVTPYGIRDNGAIRREGLDKYEGPGLAIQYVELEGPIVEQFPSRGHQMLFDGLNRHEIEPRNPNDKLRSYYKPKFTMDEQDVMPALRRIATAAFRRPASTEDVEPYHALFQQQLNEGSSVEDAIKAATAAIFCSPDFLFLKEQPGTLDNYALASRLSYFLTRTTPDAQLLEAAEAGKLTGDAEELLRQTERLLNDPRHERFIKDFTDSWLNLRDIEFTSPDLNFYPEFDDFLQWSMLAETRQFISTLIAENRSIDQLIDPDYAIMNERLADHYGIDPIPGPGLRKVAMPKGSVRGGLLGQASILKVSANGTNSSPVVRGVWVTERILGKTAPPPPPGIPGVEPDIRGASTLRELLDKHRTMRSCTACHALIDPPGFALECFDPVGGWRDRYRSLGDGEKVNLEVNNRRVQYKFGPKVDASGELPNGTKFADFLEFRQELAKDHDLLARTFAVKLLTFATGREIGFSDRPVIDRIVEQSKSTNFGIRNILRNVVMSDAFRQK